MKTADLLIAANTVWVVVAAILVMFMQAGFAFLEAGHVGVTVLEAVGHGRQRGITHEYRGRVFESRFLPKALLVFVVEDSHAEAVVEAIADAARSGNPAGDGLVWTSPIQDVTHNRTGARLEEVEAR